MLTKLSIEELTSAVSGSAAAFRTITEYQPIAGIGAKVFPPSYEGGQYATEGPRYDDTDEGRKATGYDSVLLDSVQSQANRMELALLEAWERGELSLPVITVDFTGSKMPRVLRITSLEAPHRMADALLRDSLHANEGVKFRESSVGALLDDVNMRNATPLFQFCPTALVLGMWDSTGQRGGAGTSFRRALVSEMVGYDVKVGKKTRSRIDPAQVQLAAGPLYQTKEGDWTLDESKAVKESGKAKRFGKDGKPSEANHGNVTPSIKDGGVTLSRAEQNVVLSLTALRRLRFPLNGGKSQPATDDAARTALAALGLCAVTLAREQNQDLRSRCQLFPAQRFVWELLDEPGETPKQFSLDRRQALALFNSALDQAKQAGLPWQIEEVMLKPSPQLVELVRKSQHLAAKLSTEEE